MWPYPKLYWSVPARSKITYKVNTVQIGDISHFGTFGSVTHKSNFLPHKKHTARPS